MKRLGVGLIGLGLAVKPHALALRDLADRVEFIGGYSPTPERRRHFTHTYGLPAIESLDALLGDPRVDVIVILTPPYSHGELAEKAAKAGKHVLLEKPIDTTLGRARAVVEAVERQGKKLGVVLQHRFRPGVTMLLGLMAERALGDLLSVSCAVRWWRSADYYTQPGRGMHNRDGGGVLLTQAIHTLDVMLDLAGPAKTVSAICCTSPLRAIDTEDIACAALRFVNGAVGVIDATTVAYPGFPERLECAGTMGSAVLEGERLTVHRAGRTVLQVDGSTAGGGGDDPMAFSHEPHRRLIEDFLDAVTVGHEPRASGRSALAVHALIDGMLESSRTGTPVDVASAD